MKRPFTWLSGAFLAVIFLAGGAIFHSAPAAAPAAVTVVTARSTTPARPPAPPGRDLQPVPHGELAPVSAVPVSYIVQPGDTLSRIARQLFGHADRWPALWLANRHAMRNPNKLPAGVTLSLQLAAHPMKPWIIQAALDAIPKPPKPRPVHPALAVAAVPAAASSQAAGNPAAQAAAPAPAQAPAAPAPAGQVSASGSFEACVIQAESGGNATAQNPSSSASGLYGFLDTTWTAVTGLPGPARDYSPAQQQAAFQKLYASAGTSPWAAYDGC